jgi:hypothetical protein
VTGVKPAPPLNYTTVIDPVKTAHECASMLARHHAREIRTTWQGGSPAGLEFAFDTEFGPMTFVMPVNVDGTRLALQRASRAGVIPVRYTSAEHAQRVAWRVAHDWLKVQLATVESGMITVEQVMLPWARTGYDGSGPTVWDAFTEQQRARALEAGG